ncbi:hypothetical protein, partial [Embleya sp. NPDC005971]|uniref:hypothetical protein n=1 Tax=Embleya sp. NPDC005971 TaxID=3156724 RepID=UPI0033CB31D1
VCQPGDTPDKKAMVASAKTELEKARQEAIRRTPGRVGTTGFLHAWAGCGRCPVAGVRVNLRRSGASGGGDA